jgi:hypothetical protein
VKSLVFDASPLLHFSQAARLEVLQNLPKVGAVSRPSVLDEIARNQERYPRVVEVAVQSWLTVVPIDRLVELQAFAYYARILGSGTRDTSEASVLAWAQCHDAVAVIDDQTAKRAGGAGTSPCTGRYGSSSRVSSAACWTVRMSNDSSKSSLISSSGSLHASGGVRVAHDQGLLE